jgi:hypothetical protein
MAEFIWTPPDPLNTNATSLSIYLKELQNAVDVRRIEIGQAAVDNFISVEVGQTTLLSAVEQLKTLTNQLAIDFGYVDGILDPLLLGRGWEPYGVIYGVTRLSFPIINDLRKVLCLLESQVEAAEDRLVVPIGDNNWGLLVGYNSSALPDERLLVAPGTAANTFEFLDNGNPVHYSRLETLEEDDRWTELDWDDSNRISLRELYADGNNGSITSNQGDTPVQHEQAESIHIDPEFRYILGKRDGDFTNYLIRFNRTDGIGALSAQDELSIASTFTEDVSVNSLSGDEDYLYAASSIEDVGSDDNEAVDPSPTTTLDSRSNGHISKYLKQATLALTGAHNVSGDLLGVGDTLKNNPPAANPSVPNGFVLWYHVSRSGHLDHLTTDSTHIYAVYRETYTSRFRNVDTVFSCTPPAESARDDDSRWIAGPGTDCNGNYVIGATGSFNAYRWNRTGQTGDPNPFAGNFTDNSITDLVESTLTKTAIVRFTKPVLSDPSILVEFDDGSWTTVNESPHIKGAMAVGAGYLFTYNEKNLERVLRVRSKTTGVEISQHTTFKESDNLANTHSLPAAGPSSIFTEQYNISTANEYLVSTPLAPENIGVTIAGQNATVTWDSPSGVEEPASYTVRFSETPGGSGFSFTGLTGNSYTIVGLNPNTQYYFTVQAVKFSGDSLLSEEVSGTTDP